MKIHNTNKVMTAILGFGAFGAALFSSEHAKAACDATQTVLETTAGSVAYNYDTCSQNGYFTGLYYGALFTTFAGYGIGENQIILYQNSGSSNPGFYDGVYVYCANSGPQDSHWQGPFGSVPSGGINFPPSAGVACPNAGDSAEEAEAYVYLP